jgi:hypothetical protein
MGECGIAQTRDLAHEVCGRVWMGSVRWGTALEAVSYLSILFRISAFPYSRLFTGSGT